MSLGHWPLLWLVRCEADDHLCVFICLFVCLFVCLSVCLFVYLFVCLFVYLSWPVASPVRPMRSCHHLCVFISLFVFVYLFFCLIERQFAWEQMSLVASALKAEAECCHPNEHF